jgi:hypothetical protein
MFIILHITKLVVIICDLYLSSLGLILYTPFIMKEYDIVKLIGKKFYI